MFIGFNLRLAGKMSITPVRIATSNQIVPELVLDLDFFKPNRQSQKPVKNPGSRTRTSTRTIEGGNPQFSCLLFAAGLQNAGAWTEDMWRFLQGFFVWAPSIVVLRIRSRLIPRQLAGWTCQPGFPIVL
jgi:hypothetical protein